MRNCSHKVGAILLVLVCAMTANANKNRKQDTNREELKVETFPIPAPVRYELTRQVGAGRLVKAQEGKPGAIIRTYQVSYEDGKPHKKQVKEERQDPVPTVFYMGKAGNGWQPSRGDFIRHRVLTMSATAYDPSPETIGPGATGRTRMGYVATRGMVAVDPRVIPLGSLVFVEGYGIALACDTGGAIKGNRIDLCYASKSVADAFGRKKVRVHILKTPR